MCKAPVTPGLRPCYDLDWVYDWSQRSWVIMGDRGRLCEQNQSQQTAQNFWAGISSCREILYFNYAGFITCICTNVLMCIVVIIVFLITANLYNTKCRWHNIALYEHALTHTIAINDNYICDIGVCCFCHCSCTFSSIQINCK